MRPSERAICHFRSYSDDELRAKVAGAGLEIVELVGWGFLFYSPPVSHYRRMAPRRPSRREVRTVQKTIANFLNHLYAFNIPRRGDVMTVHARPQKPIR
jgi:hypothetical protein